MVLQRQFLNIYPTIIYHRKLRETNAAMASALLFGHLTSGKVACQTDADQLWIWHTVMLVCLLLPAALAAAFSVVSYEPMKSPVEGGGEVTIKLSEELRQAPFCRFDTTIVPGSWKSETSVISCAIPAHKAGVVELAVSMDRTDWSESVNFRYYDSKRATDIVVVLIVIVSIVSFGLFLLQMRQCKNEQMRHKKNQEVGINDDHSESDDETKPLNRHAKFPM